MAAKGGAQNGPDAFCVERIVRPNREATILEAWSSAAPDCSQPSQPGGGSQTARGRNKAPYEFVRIHTVTTSPLVPLARLHFCWILSGELGVREVELSLLLRTPLRALFSSESRLVCLTRRVAHVGKRG
jgi:hypothetical protein